MEFFSRNKNKNDGHNSQCKLCHNAYQCLRRSTNFSHKINHNLKNQLNHLIRGKAPSKKLLKIFNCKKRFFFEWTKLQFNEKMNFDNYAEIWNFDHVRPLSSFNMSNEDELYEAWSWVNIRPCLIAENTAKGSTVDYELYEIQKKAAHVFTLIYEEEPIL